MSIICPKCGRSSSEVEFIDAFCKDDYPIRIKTPDRMEFEVCTRCERIRLQGEWTPFGQKKVSDYIVSKCRGEFESAEYDVERQTAVFVMKAGGVKIDRFIPLEMKKTICQQCSRISGGYFEGIIQLRGDRAKMRKMADQLIKKLAKTTFIAKEDDKDEGLDIYVGSSKAVLKVVTDLGLKSLITKKLIGRDEGKRLYRTTFRVRL